MRTLIVSIYDGCIGGYSAAILEDDGELEDIFISREYAESFIYPSENLETLKQIMQKYDHIIVCEDGTIRKVK